MVAPVLQLTPEELRWNHFRDLGDGRRAVVPKVYRYTASLTTAAPVAAVVHYPTRRSRVYRLNFSGDVYGCRVDIGSSGGDKYTTSPCHIPLLSGHSPHSTRSVFAATVAAYPVAPAASATQRNAAWAHYIDPNLVLAGDQQLLFEFSLENATDTVISGGGTYVIDLAVFSWEFPGFAGGSK